MGNYMILKLEAATLCGDREENMDVFLVKEAFGQKELWDTTVSPLLCGVYDGVGSLRHSALGAALAADKMSQVFYQTEGSVAERLLRAGWAASDKVLALNRSLGRFDAASTITAAAFQGSQMELLALGDSPAYLYRNKMLTPLFTPMRGEEGQLLGFAGQESPDFFTKTEELHAGDVVILATDGILPEKLLCWALRLDLSAKTIAWLSTRKKYADNTTLVKISVLKEDGPHVVDE